MPQKKWYASWFDTSYYHTLYKNRDYSEAQRFLDNLIEKLAPKKSDRLLDLACGKGRHSIYLAEKGYKVTGVDLSPQSIAHAKKFETKKLKFDVHDMREVYKKKHFHLIINAFTSFGYFENDEDHLQTLENITIGLRKDGQFVMDFLNVHKAIANMKQREQKTIDGIKFKLSRKVKDGYIVKKIKFTDKGKKYAFEERVRAFTKKDLQKLFKKAGLEITAIYGNYDFKAFKKNNSDRLILIAKK
ncbi:MAG: cyclopropane-fatty-acyl-phospholipid synthase family protein [Saprospiraceae bacterium]